MSIALSNDVPWLAPPPPLELLEATDELELAVLACVDDVAVLEAVPEPPEPSVSLLLLQPAPSDARADPASTIPKKYFDLIVPPRSLISRALTNPMESVSRTQFDVVLHRAHAANKR